MPELRSAARRRRRRRYRTGKALVVAGRSLVFVAILVAALTLLRAAGRHDAPPPSATAGLPPAAARPYNPAVAPSTAAPAPPPTDLIPSVGPGGAGATTIDVPVGGGDRVIHVVVASASLRPESNGAPTIESPTSVDRGGRQSGAVPGVTIGDPDGVPQGEFGLLLYAEHSTITLGEAEGMRLLIPNDAAWVAALGTIEALNAALADLRFASDRDRRTLTVVVTDFGHGNLDESLKATARISIA